jgi:Cu(I)/Ag(I) efflux system membrane fusion protein
MNNRVLVSVLGGVGVLAAGFYLGLQWQGRMGEESMEAMIAADPYSAGPFRVQVDVTPEIPVIGENTVILRLTDSIGVPVDDATISVVATMPAMNPMPEMRAFAEIGQTAPGQYEGGFDLPMDGSWPLTVEIEKTGLGNARLSFDMATRRPGLQLLSGAQQAVGRGSAAEEVPAGTISVDARRRQTIGLKLGQVTMMPLRREIRAVGRVTYDETRLSDVTLRFDSWIGELDADHVGAAVVQGETLFTVYGPDLLATQQEYLEVLRRQGSGPIVDSARRKLELWDVSPAQIAALEERGIPLDYVPIPAPRSGIVVASSVVEGSSHAAGTTLMRVADLSEVWVEAQVYEADLAMISLGMPATVTLPYMPGPGFDGEIDYIYPYLDPATRTTRVRLSLDNSAGALKPDMYAEIVLRADFGERLVVPLEAVIFAGDTRVVFEDLGDGRLAPRRIQTGLRNAEVIEVLAGLEPGVQVVTSGTFLIASESRLSSGLNQW